MASPPSARPELRSLGLHAALLALTGAALLAAGLHRAVPVAREAGVYEAICRSVLANTRTGRQALVCSAWWPPVPALLRMPLAAVLPGAGDWPFSSLVMSALAAAGTLLMAVRFFRGWRLGWISLPLAGLIAAHPAFLRAAADGSNTAPVLLLVLLTAAGLTAWQDHPQRLRALIVFAAGAALLAASAFELLPWLAAAFLLLSLTEAARPRSRSQREAILILAVLPAVSMLALWFTMNWLIMGDPLYLVRALRLASPPAAVPLAHFASSLPGAAAAGICLAVAAAGLLRRDPGNTVAGLLGIAAPATAFALSATGRLWAPVPLLYLVHPLCVIAVAHALRPRGETRRTPHRVATLAALAALAAVNVGYWADPSNGTVHAADAQPLGFTQAERNLWLPRIQAHLRAEHPRAIAFVSGFDSFLLLGHEASPPFLHALDFDVRSAEDAYPGHPLFLLVHKPVGRSGTDSIHWKYEHMYELGSPYTLYNSDWGPWRMFEIVRAPR